MKNSNDICIMAMKWLLCFIAIVAAVRLTRGVVALLIGIAGFAFAVKGKGGRAFGILLMTVIMSFLNPYILNRGIPLVMIGLRISTILISLGLICKECANQERCRIPLGGLVVYMVVACITSTLGYDPFNSYLRIFSTLVFIAGIWVGSKCLRNDMNAVVEIRGVLLGLGAFVVLGSAAIYPFPGISTLQGVLSTHNAQDATIVNEIILTQMERGASVYFCGVTSQSQALAPILAGVFGWVLCDMLFIEGRIRWLHCAIIVCGVPMFYLTRSRIGFTSICVILLFVYFYLPHKIRLSKRKRMWLNGLLVVFGFGLAAIAISAETKSQTITRWLRKQDRLNADQRTLGEAFTSSRQGLIEEAMRDFHERPILGIGYAASQQQVSTYGSSSGVWGFLGRGLGGGKERGLLPLKILAETGLVGAAMFVAFFIMFYRRCFQRRMYFTAVLFSVFLVTNIGEATLFSVAVGGCLWLYCAVGGFALDLSWRCSAQPIIRQRFALGD